MAEIKPKTKYRSIRFIIKLFLWVLFLLFLLSEMSTISKILNQMLTSGEPLPLQSFLNNFDQTWELLDSILITVLSAGVYDYLFIKYAWGGFTYAAFTWILIKELQRRELGLKHELSQKEELGRKLNEIYILLMLATIIYGLNRDLWVPYSQDLRWEINLLHKQQLSAGSYLIVLSIIWATARMPNSRLFNGSIKFHNSPKLLTYVFLVFMLDNAASFNWFPYPWGYEEIFLYGQDLFSFDKVFHFFSSSGAAVILYNYTSKPLKTVIIVLALVIFWELFEISLNPRESSDSLLDMFINSAAILITVGILHIQSRSKYESN